MSYDVLDTAKRHLSPRFTANESDLSSTSRVAASRKEFPRIAMPLSPRMLTPLYAPSKSILIDRFRDSGHQRVALVITARL